MNRTLALAVLFLFLAAGVVWTRARRRRRRAGRRLTRAMRRSLEGLGFLLNDETDRALEIFLRLAESEPEAHDVQFALAHLFRRRGELERSIRIHQNFIARPDLPRAFHVRALYELACDYLSAGLHDRAETLLKDIAEDPVYGVRALRRLQGIYEHQSAWDEAYATTVRLSVESAENLDAVLAHYRCESADRALRLGHEHEAVRLYREAVARDPRCLRAHVALGCIARSRGDDRQSLSRFELAFWSDLRFALRTYPECYTTLRRLEDRRGLLQLLERLESATPSERHAVALAALVDERIDPEHARRWLPAFLEAHPALAEILTLLGVLPSSWVEGRLPDDLPLRLRPFLVRALRFRCERCGYTLHHDGWQCPSCRSWSSLLPHLEWIDEDDDKPASGLAATFPDTGRASTESPVRPLVKVEVPSGA
jgi:lipopolysaccharide biosynthesis regulator YciM